MYLMDVKGVYLASGVDNSPVLHLPDLHTQHRIIVHGKFSSIDIEAVLIFGEDDGEIGFSTLKLLDFLSRWLFVYCYAGRDGSFMRWRVHAISANVCYHHGGVRITIGSGIYAACTQRRTSA